VQSNVENTKILDEYFNNLERIAMLKSEIIRNEKLYQETNTLWDKIWSPSKTKKVLDEIRNYLTELKSELDLKEGMVKETEKIMVWVEGGDKKSLKQLSRVDSKTCSVLVGEEYKFFKEYEDLDKFLKEEYKEDEFNSDLLRIEYVSQHNPYIKKCLDKVENSREIKVDETVNNLCKKVSWLPDKYEKIPKKYSLSKEGGKIVLRTSITFEYKGIAKDRFNTFDLVKKNIPCVSSFFAKHGIRLDLKIFDRNDMNNSVTKTDHNINLWDYYPPKDKENNWSVLSDPKLGEKDLCGTLIHDLSNRLGLKDKYPNPDCPDREIGDREDIMYTSGSIDHNYLRFKKEDIEALLAPLCDN